MLYKTNEWALKSRHYHDSIRNVETRYINSKFLKQPTTKNLTTELVQSLKNISTEKMLQLPVDSPTAN